MYLLHTSTGNTYAVMGYDLCDAVLDVNSLLNEIYLETILYNNRVYLIPYDPLTTAELEAGLSNVGKSLFSNSFTAKYKLITLIALTSLAFLFGTSAVLEYLEQIQADVGGKDLPLTYYTLLKLLRIRTKHSGAKLLRTAIEAIIHQPDAVDIKLGQFAEHMYGRKGIFKLNKHGMNLLHRRLKQLVAKDVIPVLCVSDADLHFTENFTNEYSDDPFKTTFNGILASLQNLAAWLLFGTVFLNYIASKISGPNNSMEQPNTNNNDTQNNNKTSSNNPIVNLFDTLETALNSIFTIGEHVADSVVQSLNAFVHKILIPLLYYTSMQYKISLPRIYTNSDRKATVQLSLKLKANSIYEFYDNIVIPLLYIESLALPRKYKGADKILGVGAISDKDSSSGFLFQQRKDLAELIDILPIYGPPFYVSCIIPGKVFIPFGLITEFAVSYDNSGSSMIGGQPTTVKVDLTITDLTDVIMYNYDFLRLYSS